MTPPSPPDGNIRRPHPLGAALAERLRAAPHSRVLDFGTGSGRNARALTEAGHEVCAVADGDLPDFSAQPGFAAAISTHALLHGTPASVAKAVRTIAECLAGGAPFYAAFASKRDQRYGKGTRVDEDAFAPDSGDERGVAHAYFDECGVRALLDPQFAIEALEETDVDEIAGSWAHSQRPRGSVHWFVRATRRPNQ